MIAALDKDSSLAELRRCIEDLRRSFFVDIETGGFLYLEPEELKEFEAHPRDYFGERVYDRFPERIHDLEEALKCCALERFTASGYHIIRVLDRACRAVCWALDPSRKDMEDRGWSQYRRWITEYLKSGKGRLDFTDWGEREPYFQAIHDHLEHVYLSWRNPIIHPENDHQPEARTEHSDCMY